jgi:hypothetical protein
VALGREDALQHRQTYLIVFQMVADSFLRKELLTVPQSAHLFGERFPIRSEKIEQVCLENALADAYAGNHVPRLLYRQASSE